MTDRAAKEILRLEKDRGPAMIANDADAIGRYMADDWTIIGPDGSINNKAGSSNWSALARGRTT